MREGSGLGILVVWGAPRARLLRNDRGLSSIRPSPLYTTLVRQQNTMAHQVISTAEHVVHQDMALVSHPFFLFL